jgi:cobalt-zinc-cadmium efflux system membrane fusion protein
MTEAIELTGKITLNEDQLSHVFPLVEGRVDEVKVRLGQQVKKGDLLVVVQSKEVGQGMLQLFQDRLKLEFAMAKDRWIQDVGRNAQDMIAMMREGATVESIEQALKDRPLGDYREKLMTAYVASIKAKTHLERLSPLTTSGAVPARQILEAQSDVDATRATLLSLWEQIALDTVQASRLSAQTIQELRTSIAISETNLKILGLESSDLKDIDPAVHGEQLAHYPVTAPFDGTVISKDVVLLERVGPEKQILAIADLSTVWVTADIYESHLPLLSQLDDKPIRLRCEAWPDREFEARIFYTGDVVQESTRTVALRAMASNPEGLLKPGMFVTVMLPSLMTGEVVQVPLNAIQDHEGRSFVFVQTGDAEFVRRDVALGRRNNETVEIRTGLQAGEQVVVDGGFSLKSKMLADLLAE